MIELQVLGNDAIPLNVTETSTIPLEVTMTTGGGDITVEALSVTANGTYAAPSGKAYSPVEVDVEPNLQTLSKTITPSLNAIIRDYTPDSGYDGLAEVFVTVSGIPQGTAGTPTASKGSVSNHSVEVTPSVTNTTGYIEGGTKTGTAVTVSASELVSGTKSITANGTGIDVTNYASVDVAVPSTTPTGTISITQNGTTDVTNYASANVNVPNSYSASDEGKVVSSGTLVSQTSDTVTENGTVDTTLINSLTVNVSGGGSIDLSDIKQNYSLYNIGGLFTAMEDGTWDSLEYTCVSGTNPITIDFGREIKGFLCYPKSSISTSVTGEAVRANICIVNDADAETGEQSNSWYASYPINRTNTKYGLPRLASASLVNGLFTAVPNYPSNANYHPFKFNNPYIFVYWWEATT